MKSSWEFILSFKSEIFSYFMTALLGYLVKVVQDWRKRRKGKFIWGQFTDGSPVYVVATTKKHSNTQRATPKVSLGELAAFSRLEALFRGYGTPLKLQASTEVRMQDLAGGHIIALGGPTANVITQVLLERVSTLMQLRELPISYDIERKLFLAGRDEFRTEYDAAGKETRDYGIVAKVVVETPHGKNLFGMFAFGGHSWATEGAMDVLLDFHLMKEVKRVAGKDGFIALVEFRIEGTCPKFVEFKKILKLR